MIGIFFMAVVFIPIVVIIGVFILDKPRNFRVPVLFLASLVIMVGAVVAVLALFGTALSFLIPL